MKFQNNNKKPTLAFLTLLSSCAIILYTETIPSKLQSKNQSFALAIEQQSTYQKIQKQDDYSSRDNDELIEEIHLDREWEDILGNDESGEEILLASRSI